MAEFLNRRDGETFQSIPIVAFYARELRAAVPLHGVPGRLPQGPHPRRAEPTGARRDRGGRADAGRSDASSRRCSRSPFFHEVWRCGRARRVDRERSTSGCWWARWRDRVTDLAVIGTGRPEARRRRQGHRPHALSARPRAAAPGSRQDPPRAPSRTRASCASTRRARARAARACSRCITGADVEQQPVRLRQGPARAQARTRCAASATRSPRWRRRRAAIAEEALTLIDVEYAELPAVFDPLAARAAGRPARARGAGRRTTPTCATSSPTATWTARSPAAAVVVEGEYRLNFVTPACLGTMVAIADWDAEGRLTMWSTTQVPFLYQRDLGPGARHRRRPRPRAAAAGRRQLRARPRSLPDRRHRRAAGPARRGGP